MDEVRRLADKLLGRSRSLVHLGDADTRVVVLLRAQRRGAFVLADAERLISFVDIPGDSSIRVGSESIPLLAKDNALFVGQPIALAVGKSRAEANALIADASITYASASAPTTIDCDNFSEEDVFYERLLEDGDVDSAFVSAHKVVRGRYNPGAQDAMAGFAQGAYARLREDGNIEISLATQWPALVVSAVAGVLGVGEESVNVNLCAPGRSMDNNLVPPALSACYAALAAIRTGRDAKLIYSPQEEFLYLPKRPPATIYMRVALNEAGDIVAFDADARVDMGALPYLMDEVTDRMAYTLVSFYRMGSYRVRIRAIRTEKMPMGPYATFGVAQVAFALENMMERVCREQNLDPAAARLGQILKKGENRGVLGAIKSDLPLANLVERVADVSDFSRKYAAYGRASSKRKTGEVLGAFDEGPRRGIGLATGFVASDFLHNDYACATVGVTLKAGDDVEITCDVSPENSVLCKEWRKEVSVALGVKQEQVRVVFNDSPGGMFGPAALSRSISVITPLIRGCCDDIQRRRFREGLPLMSERRWRARRRDGDVRFASLSHGLSYAACVTEVEVDPATFIVKIRGVYLTVNCGRVLNSDLVRNEVESDVMQALGWAARERVSFDADGSICDEVYRGYLAPGVYSHPSLWMDIDVGSPRERSRGVGGLAQCCFPAAYAQAIGSALAVEPTSLPLYPQDLFKLWRDSLAAERGSTEE